MRYTHFVSLLNTNHVSVAIGVLRQVAAAAQDAAAEVCPLLNSKSTFGIRALGKTAPAPKRFSFAWMRALPHITDSLWPLPQPCVCGETCGCGTIKIPKEEVIKGTVAHLWLPFYLPRSLVSSHAAIKASKAAAATPGR